MFRTTSLSAFATPTVYQKTGHPHVVELAIGDYGLWWISHSTNIFLHYLQAITNVTFDIRLSRLFLCIPRGHLRPPIQLHTRRLPSRIRSRNGCRTKCPDSCKTPRDDGQRTIPRCLGVYHWYDTLCVVKWHCVYVQ